MGKLIDANHVLDALSVFGDREHGDPNFFRGIESAREIIEDAPTVDAVEVVRCRDCKYFELDSWDIMLGRPIIVAHEICKFDVPMKVSQNHFCAWGERREDGKTY